MKGRYTVETFKGRGSQFYWRMKAHNGRIVADGGEGYNTRSGAKRAAKQFIVMIERGLYNFEGEQGKVK